MHHVLPRGFDGEGRFFSQGAAGWGHGVTVQEAALDQALGDELDTAGLVEISGGILAAWHQVGNQWRAARDHIEVIDAQLDAGFPGEGEQVEDTVG